MNTGAPKTRERFHRPHAPRLEPRDWIGALLPALAALLSYRWILELSWTGIDTFPTIAAARVDSWSELIEVLGRELRGGIHPDLPYYRPLTLLSYTADFTLWGWLPFGYHLTDLTLHALAAAMVFWMARLAFDRPFFQSLIVSGLFVLHPSTIEVVPAIARRQEPMLVCALAIMLIGARSIPSRAGRWMTLLGAFLAVTSAERGLVSCIVLFSYLVGFRGDRYRRSGGIRRLVVDLLPVALLMPSFLLARAILVGGGGVTPTYWATTRLPLRLLEWLLYPQQAWDLGVLDDAHRLGLIAALGVVLLAIGMYAPADDRRIHLTTAGWIGGYFLLCGIAGQANPWYVYTAAPALALSLTTMAARALADARRRVVSPAPLRWVPIVMAAALCGFVAFPQILASPALEPYGAWHTTSQLGDAFLSALREKDAQGRRTLPPHSAMVVFNLPAHFTETNGNYRVTRSAAALWERSVDSWLENVGTIEHPVIVLGHADFVGRVERPHIEPVGEDRLRIFFTDGHATYKTSYDHTPDARPLPTRLGRGMEFPWPPPRLRGTPFTAFVFDGGALREIPLPHTRNKPQRIAGSKGNESIEAALRHGGENETSPPRTKYLKNRPVPDDVSLPPRPLTRAPQAREAVQH